jgi:hypothetical protein
MGFCAKLYDCLKIISSPFKGEDFSILFSLSLIFGYLLFLWERLPAAISVSLRKILSRLAAAPTF